MFYKSLILFFHFGDMPVFLNRLARNLFNSVQYQIFQISKIIQNVLTVNLKVVEVPILLGKLAFELENLVKNKRLVLLLCLSL